MVVHLLDINECMRNVCPANKECRNTDGGYQCFDSCPAGMTTAEGGACVGESSQKASHMIFIILFIQCFIYRLFH